MRMLGLALLLTFFQTFMSHAAENTLAGTWQILMASENGQALPDEALKDSKMVMTEKEFMIQSLKGEVLEKSEYAVIAEGKPSKIDFTKTEPGGTTKQLYHGIFELDGDTLKMAVTEDGKNTPKDFNPGAGVIVYSFKKKK